MKTYVQFQSEHGEYEHSEEVEFVHLPRVGDELTYRGYEYGVEKVRHHISYDGESEPRISISANRK